MVTCALHSTGWLAVTLVAALHAPATEARAQAPVDYDAAFAQRLRPLFTRHCGACHSTEKAKGDLDLERFDSAAAIRREPGVWLDVVDKIASGEMPPAKAPQPGAAEREQMLAGVRDLLAELARAQAGDPGPVVLRRLDNAAFTYAIRDLTGVATLDPAREFPVDGAAGEGFTNVGNALVMSPTLAAKYLAAAKAIAEHALLLPDGLRFCAAATRRDQTDERLAAIRSFYRRHTDPRGANVVVVQGLSFQGDVGGRLPAATYFDATLALRDGAHDAQALHALAAAGGLSPKYLERLWRELAEGAPSLLLDDLRARWRTAPAGSGAALAAAIAPWQQRLFAFRTVGHIGKLGGPKAWLEPVDAVVEQQEVSLPLPAADARGVATVHLVARSAGAGEAIVLLREPRLVRAGRPDLALRDVRGLGAAIAARRSAIATSAASCLAAVAAVQGGRLAAADAAATFGVDAALLNGWLVLLGLDARGTGGAIDAQHLLARPVHDSNGHRAVQGWTAGELPTVLANNSDEALQVPGTMAPRRVAVHPTPQQRVVAAWLAPRAERARIAVRVQRAHLACGNGVAWALQVRRGGLVLHLADGVAADAAAVTANVDDVALAAGDFVALAIAARDGDHTCDLTTIDLVITAADGTVHDLAADVAPDILAGNPHPDCRGRAGAWRFVAEAEAGERAGIPAGSALGAFALAADDAQRERAAQRVQQLLAGRATPERDEDRALLAHLQAIDGPLYRDCRPDDALAAVDDGFGCAPACFDGRDLLLRSDAAVALRVPAAFAAGATLVATATVAATSDADGAQVQARGEPPAGAPTELLDAPLLARSPAARQRLTAACEAFRDLLPPALCYAQIVPVDEAVTLTQYHREDDALRRLLLDDDEAAQLDRLWRELHFVAQDALTAVDAYEQIWQYATQDADPKAFEPLREPIRARAEAFRAALRAAEPSHLAAVLAFADRAWRRPLTADEEARLRALYQQLRQEELAHDDAIRLLLARVLASPNFLYRAEAAPSGAAAAPVTALELATRLSFFLTASPPDAALRAAAADDALLRPDVLIAQGRRLLAGPGAERLAREFGLSWLHLRDFAGEAEKSERLFPDFRALRGAMQEEVVRFLTDWLQRDGALDELLAADHTFVDDALAAHYGVPAAGGAGSAGGWRRVTGMRALGRGGLLGTAAVLASQSGASRTSPILRGNWIAEALLGDKLPKPPKSVPKLPDDETTEALTMRELTERHRRDPDCARCHDRIDHYGLALEAFDAIGRRRTQDLGGRSIDVRVVAPDGAVFTDLDGLRDYLLTQRRAAFERQFLRKLLGYALGRAVLLSDQPLLDEIQASWPQHGHRIGYAIERILASQQFRCARGRDWSER